MDLDDLYQEVILDHSRRPRNFGELPGATHHACGNNPNCGDEITVSVRITPEGTIDEIRFHGQGCAISQASASLMTLKVKRKNLADALALVERFHALLTSPDEPPEPAPQLGDAQALTGVRKFPQRIKCATLAWHALRDILVRGSACGGVPAPAPPQPPTP